MVAVAPEIFVQVELFGDDCHWMEQVPVPPEDELESVKEPPTQIVPPPLIEIAGSAVTFTVTGTRVEAVQEDPDHVITT